MDLHSMQDETNLETSKDHLQKIYALTDSKELWYNEGGCTLEEARRKATIEETKGAPVYLHDGMEKAAKKKKKEGALKTVSR